MATAQSPQWTFTVTDKAKEPFTSPNKDFHIDQQFFEVPAASNPITNNFKPYTRTSSDSKTECGPKGFDSRICKGVRSGILNKDLYSQIYPILPT